MVLILIFFMHSNFSEKYLNCREGWGGENSGIYVLPAKPKDSEQTRWPQNTYNFPPPAPKIFSTIIGV